MKCAAHVRYNSYTMKRLFGTYLLLLVLYTSTARGDGNLQLECNQDGLKLKDALRESSCRMKGNFNDTEKFGAGVRTKHGVDGIGFGALIVNSCRILLMLHVFNKLMRLL